MAELKKHAPLDGDAQTSDPAPAPGPVAWTPGTATVTEADDLEILIGAQTVPIRGEEVTVREFNFGEQLKHWAALTALSDALAPAFDAPEEEKLTKILDALATHGEAILPLAALASGKTVEWMRALNGDEGAALLLAFWTVNVRFFVRRLQRQAFAREVLNVTRAGAPSSPPSSGTDTAPAT
jgi:hypothetical protein